MLGVDDDRVRALVQPSLSPDLPATRFAREHVVRGDDDRRPAREQMGVEMLDGQPLEVDDVSLETTARYRSMSGTCWASLVARRTRDPGSPADRR